MHLDCRQNLIVQQLDPYTIKSLRKITRYYLQSKKTFEMCAGNDVKVCVYW